MLVHGDRAEGYRDGTIRLRADHAAVQEYLTDDIPLKSLLLYQHIFEFSDGGTQMLGFLLSILKIRTAAVRTEGVLAGAA